jgi:hypothetical protein
MTDDSKPKTLSDLQKELPSIADISRIYAEVQLAEDYTAAILSSSLMDTMLRYLITSHFIPMGSDRNGEIFDGQTGALNTFSSKIQISYVMGLIGPETRGALDTVRRIRNFFAHYASQGGFDIPEVLAECRKIRTPRMFREFSHISPILTDRNPPKLNYIHVCSTISLHIHNYVIFKGKLISDVISIFLAGALADPESSSRPTGETDSIAFLLSKVYICRESAERHATTFDHKFFLVVNLDVGLRHCYRGN